MSFYNENEKAKQYKQEILTYEACKNIYRSSVMGKRVVEALVNFAMSTSRDITVQKAPPEAVERFNDVAKELKQDEMIKRTIYNARIFGTGALFVALFNKELQKADFTTKPNFTEAENYDIKFNVLDPQNLSGATMDVDPMSFHFLELIDIKIQNKLIPRKRIAISHALEPLYLDARTSLIPYSPPSVFYNMIDLLKNYDQAIESLDNLLYKSGAIIYKYPAESRFSGIKLDAIKKSSYILEQKKTGNVIAIGQNSEIADFPINNVNGLIDAVNKLEDSITKALNDTPASLLFDKSLSNGFSEGDKDKETEISIVEAFRENKLTPLFNLTDYYVMLKAWDNNFINEMKDSYSNFSNKSNTEIFTEWVNSFKYKFGNLYPEPESSVVENISKKLDNLLKVKQLGGNLADIEAELNEDKIFKNEIDLDGEEPKFMNEIDANMLRIDDNIPEGAEWKTLDNGEHVLVKNGEIIAEAGIEQWKNKDKIKSKNNENNEAIKNSKTEKQIKTITAGQYRENQKEIEFSKKKIAELEDTIKRFPNDKMFNVDRQEEIEWHKKQIEIMEEENKQYESGKDKINAEAGKDKQSNKKITKNYSIAYDKSTIDKLNSLGKNWQDKRIYFKELNNSYYDLEKEKWVCDSPETTKKALELASENTEERTNRLQAEEEARKQAEEERRQAEIIAREERQARERPVAMRVYDKLRDAKTFRNNMFKAMNDAGIFEEFSIPKGSINKIADTLFTSEEQDAWKGIDKYDSDFRKLKDIYSYHPAPPTESLKDFIYEEVKSELNHINDMYKPLRWRDWLEVTNDTILDNMSNGEAWERYGEEFERYKKEYRESAEDRIKNYLQERLSPNDTDTDIVFYNSIHKNDSKINIKYDTFIDNLIKSVEAKINAME